MTKKQDNAAYIRGKRKTLNLSERELSIMLDMKEKGEQTVIEWERGERTITKAKLLKLEDLKIPGKFIRDENKEVKFRFIDLFAGIGGIRIPFQELGGKCVFTSEWDSFANKTYISNFGGNFAKSHLFGDITKVAAADVPPHDILLGGFPCQTFSQAGHKKGFDDTRGTMFFEIQRLLAEKRPKAFLLENVKQLRGHDKGRTLETILSILRGEHTQEIPDDVPMSEEARDALTHTLNYSVDYKV